MTDIDRQHRDRFAATATIPTWELSHRLSRALEWGGMSPHDMAEHLDMSTNTIWNYLSGRTTPKRVVVLYWATVTGVDVDWLLRGITPGHDDGAPQSTNGYSPRRLSFGCATTYADAA